MQRAGIAILLFTGFTRLLRAGLRWEEWALHYAAYNLEAQEAIQSTEFLASLQSWVGLHPPLYPILHGLMNGLWASPATWLLFSAACSVGAVAFMLKAHPGQYIPALLLATDPVQIHYAAEVNNYPLSVLFVSGVWWAFQTHRVGALRVFACLALWTHIMAGAVCALIAVLHKDRWKTLLCMGLLSLPLWGPAIGLVMDPGSQNQPELNIELSLQDAIDRFGLGWLALLPMLVMGASGAHAAAAVWAGTCFFWFFMVGLGIAAPHQFPYALYLGIPAAALLASSARRNRPFAVLIVGVALLRGLWGTGSFLHQGQQIWSDLKQTRGVDTVLSLSLPGDAIVLVRGPGAPDDDRRHFSSVLWRFSPFESMPAILTGVRPDLVGQPRLYAGRRIYTFAHPRPSIGEIPGHSIFTVLYDGAEHNPDRIPSHPLQGEWEQSGPDLWRGPNSASPDL